MISTTLPRSEIGGLTAAIVGQGPPVVLLHGVGLRAEAWTRQIAGLEDTFRLIAPDLPGHGASFCPAAAPSLAGYAALLLPLLKEVDQPVVLVGHSIGALIALELVNASAGQIRAVAALNPVFERSPEAAEAVRARAAALDGKTLPDPEPTLSRWFSDDASPERAACESWLRSVDPLGYKHAYSAFAEPDGPSRTKLAGVTCPTLFATGDRDPNSTPAMSREMASLAPFGRSLIVEGAAHMMPLTHAERTNAALLALVRDAGI